MSRYPGTQFRVHDNSQATAIVPITKANANVLSNVIAISQQMKCW